MLRTAGHNWPHLIKYVKTFVRECPLCQTLCNVKPVINTLPFHLANVVGPMIHLGVDTKGPFIGET
jgi:hypothetical protein